MEKELRRQELEVHLYLKPALIQEAARKFNIHSEEDLYVAVGTGRCITTAGYNPPKGGIPQEIRTG
jgi:(p)ppGpp synthase/HD superfamily hydrolase